MLKIKLGLGGFLVLSTLVTAILPTSAANWPRFRGPNGTGIAQDKNIPVKWSDQDGVLWKAPIPGVGNSSPIVWGDRVFVQSASADGKERMLLSLSTADGKLLWARSLPGTTARINARNSLASATPATDGERVYTAFWDGEEVTLYAFDFAGKQLWKRGIGGFVSQHGAGASPVVCGDKVIFLNDQDKYKEDKKKGTREPGGPSELLALDAKTGKLAWEVKRQPHRACYGAPLILEKPNGKQELLVATTTGVHGYDPQTGRENWHWNWTFSGMALRMVGCPVYHQGMLFLSSGDGSGERNFACIKVGDQGDVTKSNLLWQTKKRTSPYVPCVLASGDYLFFVNDQGLAECHVAKTGELVWSERLGVGVTASPVLIDGKIYTIDEAGTAFVLAAGPQFKILAKNSMGESVMASPAVADGRLYIRGKNHLFCIAKPAGK
jgi:outer membrane protein assembly factor BamB